MTVVTGGAFCHAAWFGNVGLRVGDRERAFERDNPERETLLLAAKGEIPAHSVVGLAGMAAPATSRPSPWWLQPWQRPGWRCAGLLVFRL